MALPLVCVHVAGVMRGGCSCVRNTRIGLLIQMLVPTSAEGEDKRVWLAKGFCSKNSRWEREGNVRAPSKFHFGGILTPFPRSGFRKKPKVIWFQLHAVKIEFVARN